MHVFDAHAYGGLAESQARHESAAQGVGRPAVGTVKAAAKHFDPPCWRRSGATDRGALRGWRPRLQGELRPISLLRLSLLRFLDSNFPGNSLWT